MKGKGHSNASIKTCSTKKTPTLTKDFLGMMESTIKGRCPHRPPKEKNMKTKEKDQK